MQSKNSIVIIDGNSLINRAYYAIQKPMMTKDGFYTQGIYGFLSMLAKIRRDYSPTHMLVAFDRKAPTFRHIEYPDYKAGRKKMPEELAMEVPVLKEALHDMGIFIYEEDGWEADDIIGTTARMADEADIPAVVVTGDKDALQLANHNTSVVITKRGISEFKLYDDAAMMEEYGFSQDRFIDFKALKGDPSDNIPGVPGVGDKTAQKLIVQFGTIENMLEHADEIENAKLREKILNNKDTALLSKHLSAIVTSVPVDYTMDDLVIKEKDYEKLIELYRRLEFRTHMNSILKEYKEHSADGIKSDGSGEIQMSLLGDFGSTHAQSAGDAFMSASAGIKLSSGSAGSGNIMHISDLSDAAASLNDALDSGVLWCSLKTNDDHVNTPSLEGFSFLSGSKTVFLDLQNTELKKILTDAFSGKKCSLAGFGLQNLFYAFAANGIDISGLSAAEDAALSQYVLQPGTKAPDLSQLLLENLHAVPGDENVLGCVRQLCEMQDDEIKSENLENVLRNIELPLSPILASMENSGIRLDTAELRSFGEELKAKIKTLEEEIWSLAGEEFNINSPKQLGIVLFDTLGLPGAKKTKSGYSTNADILDKLKDDYPIVDKVLEYRTLSKLNSTYVEGLIPLVGQDGKIHAHYQQTVTSTGRLSCTDPNLQNIPVRYELGRQLRKAFKADDDRILIGADYSQIELRVLAHMSGDPALIRCFNEGLDIHRETASKVFGVPFDEVSSQMRSNAKAVNFGVIYGMSGFGLASELTITKKEAEKYISDYFERFKDVKIFMDGCVKKAKDEGSVRTLYGRKRNIPEIRSSAFMQRQLGERLAMNTPIQGTAADIIKLAMIKVQEALTKEKLESRLILQVHDELIIHAKKEEAERVRVLLKECMENAVQLKVKLEVSLEEGECWFDLK